MPQTTSAATSIHINHTEVGCIAKEVFQPWQSRDPHFGMLSQKAAIIHVIDMIAGKDQHALRSVGLQQLYVLEDDIGRTSAGQSEPICRL